MAAGKSAGRPSKSLFLIVETTQEPSISEKFPLYQRSVCSRHYALWLAIRTPFLVAVLTGLFLTYEALIPNPCVAFQLLQVT
jgi:hypothetical protein